MNGYEDMNDEVKSHEWLWRYEWWSEITKWRLDDVMVWVIRLKRLLYPFLIMVKILWKFEDDWWFRFWDIFNTKFIQKEIQKRFVQTWLRAIYRRWRHPIGRNLVSEYFQMTFWIENLTMFPTCDQKTETTLPIAQSLSYNILKFGRKLWNNNRDTGQKTLSCRFMFWKKVTSHRHNTQIWQIMHCRL